MNPKLIEYAGKKMIVTVLGTYILAVNAKDGKIIWKLNYPEINAATGQGNGKNQRDDSPLQGWGTSSLPMGITG